MRYLSHIIRTKGLFHAIERALQVAWRYSLGEKRFSEMMSTIDGIFLSRGVKVTFCITASLLKNHSGLLKKYSSLGHEFAAHGFHHTDIKKKTSTSKSRCSPSPTRASRCSASWSPASDAHT